MDKQKVPASVKDERLVQMRRDQMIKGAVALFKEKGFHRTTTREIARASGFSIGTLYEYIRKKEDVLYLVCDSIYDQVQERMKQDIEAGRGGVEDIKNAVHSYFKVMDEMQDEVLVMYQEAKSLSKDALPYVLQKEIEMVGLIEKVIKNCADSGVIDLTDDQIKLASHNVFVQGQMWGFRRWALRKMVTLEQYTDMQVDFLLHGIMPGMNGEIGELETFHNANVKEGENV